MSNWLLGGLVVFVVVASWAVCYAEGMGGLGATVAVVVGFGALALRALASG
jgi:hypothetical protein